MAEPRKSFAKIKQDYLFFEQHTDEISKSVDGYLPYIQSAAFGKKELHLCDFGCGEGNFLKALLEKLNFPQKKLALYLLEPEPVYLRSARDRIAPFAHTVRAYGSIEALKKSNTFDVIVSHHVLYYVNELKTTLNALLRTLSSHSILLASLGNSKHGLIKAWGCCFAKMGKTPPFFRTEDVKGELESLGVAFDVKEVSSTLQFVDSFENRMKIFRFLFGETLEQIPAKVTKDFFDTYTSAGRVTMKNFDDLYVVRM